MAEIGDGALREELAGEVRTLRLALGDLERIEKLTGCGIYELGTEFFGGKGLNIQRVRSVLIAALAGGGMEIGEAEKVAEDAFASPMKAMLVARSILGLALMPEAAERTEKKTKARGPKT